MKYFEVWFCVLITYFLIHVIDGKRYQYGNSRVHRKSKKSRSSAERLTPLPASVKQLQTSASSPDVVRFLQNFNKSAILNIGSINDMINKENYRNSDVLTVAIPITELKSLEDGIFTAQELSLSDLNKLSENIKHLGLTVDGYDQKVLSTVVNPTDINLREEPVSSRQFIRKEPDQDVYYPRTGNGNNFERNQQPFQRYDQRQFNQHTEYNVEKPAIKTAMDSTDYLSTESGSSDSAGHNLYSSAKRQQDNTKQPANSLNGGPQQRQNTYHSKNSDAKPFDEYNKFTPDKGQFSNINQQTESYEHGRNTDTITNEYHSDTSDTNLHHQNYQHSEEQKFSTQYGNKNLQNKETGPRHLQENGPNNFANYQTVSNMHHQSSVSYLPSVPAENEYFQNTEADQNKRHSNNDANQLPIKITENTFGENVIINRIGETGIDFPQNSQEVTTQGNYKGDDGSDRFGSIPGIGGVDYPNYLSIPKTGFDCRQYNYPGYFADMEAHCQVYHICQADGRHNSFLCPVGTLFNQKVLVCDWWYNTDCAASNSYFDRNAYLHQQSLDAGNYKGHHQSNIQLVNSHTGQSFGTSSESYKLERIDQKINLFNDNSELKGENLNLVDERSPRRFTENHWEDVSNDFSKVQPTKYHLNGEVAISTNEYVPLRHFGSSNRVEKTDQNVKSFNDVSETQGVNLDIINEKKRLTQNENNWEGNTNVFSRESKMQQAPEGKIAVLVSKYLPSEQTVHDKPIGSLYLVEEAADKPAERNFDLWTRRDVSDQLEGRSIPIDKNVFRSQENMKRNQDEYSVSVPLIRNRIDKIIQIDGSHPDNEVVNRELGKSITLPENYAKLEVNSASSEENVKNGAQAKIPSLYESQYFRRDEESHDNEHSNEEFSPTEVQTDTVLQGKALNIENSKINPDKNIKMTKTAYENPIRREENDQETEKEELEEYDERPQMTDTLLNDILSEEDGFESNEDSKEIIDSTMHVFNPVTNQNSPISEESAVIDDRIVGMTTVLPSAEIQITNLKADNNKIKSNENVRPDDERDHSYVPLVGYIDKRKAIEQEYTRIYKNSYRPSESFDVSESELEENKPSLNESVIKPEDINQGKDFSKKVPEIKVLNTDDIRSKTASLGDEIRDILTELASGDRLYKNILISEVISPRYQNSVKHNGQRLPMPMKIERNVDIAKNNMLRNEDKFDNSEISAVMKTEKYPFISHESSEINQDSTSDTAESRLHEAVIKPYENTFSEEETSDIKHRTALKYHRNSSRTTRARFNDTARRRQLTTKK